MASAHVMDYQHKRTDGLPLSKTCPGGEPDRDGVLDIYDVCASSFGRDCIECERKIVILPDNVSIHVVTTALCRLPFLRTKLCWEPDNKPEGSIFEEQTDAFRMLLAALHTRPSTWAVAIPGLAENCLNVLQVAKKYQYLELEEYCRKLVVSSISSQNVRDIACYIDRQHWDVKDGNLSECVSPEKTRDIAKGLVMWFRLKPPQWRYVKLLAEMGHTMPTWCLLALVSFCGDPARREAAIHSLWNRGSLVLDSRDHESGSKGWDSALKKVISTSDDYAHFYSRILTQLANNHLPNMSLSILPMRANAYAWKPKPIEALPLFTPIYGLGKDIGGKDLWLEATLPLTHDKGFTRADEVPFSFIFNRTEINMTLCIRSRPNFRPHTINCDLRLGYASGQDDLIYRLQGRISIALLRSKSVLQKQEYEENDFRINDIRHGTAANLAYMFSEQEEIPSRVSVRLCFQISSANSL